MSLARTLLCERTEERRYAGECSGPVSTRRGLGSLNRTDERKAIKSAATMPLTLRASSESSASPCWPPDAAVSVIPLRSTVSKRGRLNLVFADELMRSPIAAVRIADGRSREARVSIFYDHRCV
jgi:hypothetical protein